MIKPIFAYSALLKTHHIEDVRTIEAVNSLTLQNITIKRTAYECL